MRTAVWKWERWRPRRLDRNTQIFSHPVYGETEVKFSSGHCAGAVIHLPGLGSALSDNLYDILDIETRALSEMNAL